MSDGTKIEWTDATWNPITGCSVKSPGCTNCYAQRLAGTRMKHHWSRKGLTFDTKAGPVWNGETRFNEEWLTQPLQWSKPRMIFVCAHGDLFHESVPDEWIDKVFAVMALCPQHTFQVLTKRSARMRAYFAWEGTADDGYWQDRKGAINAATASLAHSLGIKLSDDAALPLPNVWLGVSVEDQTRADERIPDLLATSAAVRWISAEPLLGPVNLTEIEHAPAHMIHALWGLKANTDGTASYGPKLDWVVAGGESGPNARIMQIEWARSLRDQCAASGTAFMFKQMGEWCAATQIGFHGFERCERRDIAPQSYMRVGKKLAGRLLDGVQHDGYPA